MPDIKRQLRKVRPPSSFSADAAPCKYRARAGEIFVSNMKEITRLTWPYWKAALDNRKRFLRMLGKDPDNIPEIIKKQIKTTNPFVDIPMLYSWYQYEARKFKEWVTEAMSVNFNWYNKLYPNTTIMYSDGYSPGQFRGHMNEIFSGEYPHSIVQYDWITGSKVMRHGVIIQFPTSRLVGEFILNF